MSPQDEFLAAYELQIDFWEAVAARARAMIEAELNSSGLRAIVSSRAKSIERLRTKIQQRHPRKHYTSAVDISEDIADLAGVRVALYFPGQIDEAERIISAKFNILDRRRFPSTSGSRRGQPRFSGYGARHFRVRIPQSALPDAEIRYGNATIEVQVATVLMHAWSEVEHDLVYKPLEGELSDTEYALLDQLNGLVLAGEIALEQLQQAGEQRARSTTTRFRSHYDLAEYLRTQRSSFSRLSDSDLGAVDILYTFLGALGRTRPDDVAPYLADLDENFEERPVAEQIADLIVGADPKLYTLYQRASSLARHPSLRPKSMSEGEERDFAAVGEFIKAWADFEKVLGDLTGTGQRLPIRRKIELARNQGLIEPETFVALHGLIDVRNRVVHPDANSEVFQSAPLYDGTKYVQAVTAQLMADRSNKSETAS